MNYREYPPPAPLRDTVNCIWSMRSTATAPKAPHWDRTLPDGSLEIVLHLGEPMWRKPLDGAAFRESRALLIGQTTRPYLFGWSGAVHMLGIRFLPHAAGRLLDGPVHVFNDRSVNLDDALAPGALLRLDEIAAAPDDRAAVQLLERWLLQRLDATPLPRGNAYLQYATTRLLAQGGGKLADVRDALGISSRYLERLFREGMGVSPKLFSRIVRFQHTLHRLNVMPRELTRVALDTGYFDQSHFIREFRDFAGLAPRAFLREPHPVTAHFADAANSSYLYNFR